MMPEEFSTALESNEVSIWLYHTPAAPTSPQMQGSLESGFQDKLTLLFLWELSKEGSLCPISQESVIVGSLLLVSRVPETAQGNADGMLVPC